MAKPHLMVTGASGLLGANFCLEASDQGYPVTAIYHTHPISAPNLQAIQANLLQDATSLLEHINPDWIIHCAAWTDVDACEANPQQSHNIHVDLSQELAKAAQNHHAKMVYISTDSVFDGQTGNYTETDPPAPLNVYAHSKLMGEHAVQKELKENCLIVRTNIFGWNAQDKHSLAEWMLSQLTSHQTINGFTDVIFAPLLVNTLSQWILWSTQANLSGLYHVGNQTPCSKYEFAQHLAHTFQIESPDIRPTSIDKMALKTPRPKNTALNMKAISLILDEPIPTLQSELAKFSTLHQTGFVDRLKSMIKG